MSNSPSVDSGPGPEDKCGRSTSSVYNIFCYQQNTKSNNRHTSLYGSSCFSVQETRSGSNLSASSSLIVAFLGGGTLVSAALFRLGLCFLLGYWSRSRGCTGWGRERRCWRGFRWCLGRGLFLFLGLRWRRWRGILLCRLLFMHVQVFDITAPKEQVGMDAFLGSNKGCVFGI